MRLGPNKNLKHKRNKMHLRSFASRKKHSAHKWKRNIWSPYFLISLQIIHSISGRGVPAAVHLTVCPPVEPWWSSTKSRIDAGTASSGKKSELDDSWPQTSENYHMEYELRTCTQGIRTYKSGNHPRGGCVHDNTPVCKDPLGKEHFHSFCVWGFVPHSVLNLRVKKAKSPCGYLAWKAKRLLKLI